MSLSTPILFLVFNRPDVTATVFEAIRRAKPRQLFVAADGARPHVDGEAERCAQVRSIVQQIDWECELKTRFLDQNLGCGKGVSSAIRWYFDNVEAGIILEDDCLPDPSFFKFCHELLERYKTDQRVMMISGDNFQDGHRRGEGSYYFSRLAHIWGWATWRRVWDLYDFKISDYPQQKQDGFIQRFHPDPAVQEHYIRTFDTMYTNPIDTWDFQLCYTVMKHGGFSVIPNVNLVTNIGFGADATHTHDANSSLANIAKQSLDTIVHPSAVAAHREADDYTFKNVLRLPLTQAATVSLNTPVSR